MDAVANIYGLPHESVEFYFLAVEKTPPYAVLLCPLGEDFIDQGRREYMQALRVDLLIMCGVVSDYQEGMQNFGVVTHFMRQLVAHGCERIPLSDTYTNRLFGYWKREIK